MGNDLTNDKVQQRGRLQERHTVKSRIAGPVCCNAWFFGGREK
jgi:hypothetical protein